MAKNKMKEVAELLGIELNEPFKIKGEECEFKLTKDGLIVIDGNFYSIKLKGLLTGELEIEQPILDKVEKRYLEGVLRPFKDRVNYIKKISDSVSKNEFIKIMLNHDVLYNEEIYFPFFEKGTMYKGMEYKEYTLEELGLFQD